MISKNNKSNKNFINFIILIVVIVFFDVLGMHCLRYHNENDNIKFFYLSCFIYGVIISFLVLKSLNFSSIPVINFSWFCIGTLINIMIGIYIYKEKLNYLKLLGIIIAFIGASIIFYAD
jgi:multidrug transporter EmrE-like cation transporter